MSRPVNIAQRSLGRSGLSVSALGFGTAPLGDLYQILDDATAIDAIVAAIEAGVTLIDTSPLYGHGLAEHRVAAALRRVGRDRVVLSTKVGRVLQPARGQPLNREGYAGGLPFNATLDYSYDATLRAFEQSLQRLGTDHVEIVLIHDLDLRHHGKALAARVDEAVTGAFVALQRLRDEGVVKAIGLGVNEAEVCADVAQRCDIDAVLLAGRYSLLEQGAHETFLKMAAARGIGIMLGGVFNSGILATGAIPGARYDYAPASPDVLDLVGRIDEICQRHGVALPVAAVAFVRAHAAVSSVVLGGVSRTEVERNVAGWSVEVPRALWSDLRSAGLLRGDVPVPDEPL